DGNADFFARALPLLKEFGFPVTVYLTTFYSQFNRPVFGVFCDYLLWKGRSERLNLEKITRRESGFDLRSVAGRKEARGAIEAFVGEHGLTAEEKDALAARLAKQLRIDYHAVIEKRLFHLLSPAEVKQLPAEGIDIQLHTHRHCTPKTRELFLREIQDNRASI